MKKQTDVVDVVAKAYDNVPHLPGSVRKLLAANIWWMALIGAILSCFGLIVVVPLFVTLLATYGNPFEAASGLSTLGLPVNFVAYIASTILLTISFSHLRERQLQGWIYLFWVYIINYTLNFIGMLLTLNIFGAATTVISAGIAGYFLFEIHDYFKGKNAKKKSRARSK